MKQKLDELICKPFLSIPEYARLFSMNQNSIRSAIKRGDIASMKVGAGKQYRIVNPAYTEDIPLERLASLEKRVALLEAHNERLTAALQL